VLIHDDGHFIKPGTWDVITGRGRNCNQQQHNAGIPSNGNSMGHGVHGLLLDGDTIVGIVCHAVALTTVWRMPCLMHAVCGASCPCCDPIHTLAH
jgi:hypothetical protein